MVMPSGPLLPARGNNHQGRLVPTNSSQEETANDVAMLCALQLIEASVKYTVFFHKVDTTLF